MNYLPNAHFLSSMQNCVRICIGYQSYFPTVNLKYITKPGSRDSCLALTGFAAFGKGVQLVSWSLLWWNWTISLTYWQVVCLLPHDDKHLIVVLSPGWSNCRSTFKFGDQDNGCSIGWPRRRASLRCANKWRYRKELPSNAWRGSLHNRRSGTSNSIHFWSCSLPERKSWIWPV